MGLPASGGLMSGGIFHHISEGVMAKSLKLRVEDARDSLLAFAPDVKGGDNAASTYILNELGIKNAATPETPAKITEGKMPDVIDMGARDAIYLLERQGVKVQLHGMGRVKRQSIAAGSELKQGMVCVLELQ